MTLVCYRHLCIKLSDWLIQIFLAKEKEEKKMMVLNNIFAPVFRLKVPDTSPMF